MTGSLRALLAGSIDYAGLFPPASLPLDQAISNYSRYRREPESWLLGRFVCPAARLTELDAFAELLQADPPFVFSVLARGGHDVVSFGSAIRTDLDAIAAFRERYGPRVLVQTLEARLPEDVTRSQTPDRASVADKLANFIGGLTGLVASQPDPTATLYWEFSFGPDWRTMLTTVIAGLASAQQPNAVAPGQAVRAVGLKLRCGGAASTAFPPAEQVAAGITRCRDAGVPIKFTAGLHHPIRRFDAGCQTHMHGFLNVLAAAVLAHARRVDEDQVTQILVDEDPASFVFDEHGFRWKALRAGTDEITLARQAAVISLGSCSFDEPRDDLRNLGLL